jgi:hypothetical protein
MMRLTWIIGALGTVAASFFITLYILDQFQESTPAKPQPIAVGTCGGPNPFHLSAPYDPFGGFAFTANAPKFHDDSDSMDNGSRSHLVLCEDGHPLGPPHSMHDDIRQKGLGRYSHWGDDVEFSASDNSNPNTNGRTYWVIAGQ